MKKITIFKCIFAFYILSILVILFFLHTNEDPLNTHSDVQQLKHEINVTKKNINTTLSVKHVTTRNVIEITQNNKYMFGPGINGTAIKIPRALKSKLRKYMDRNHGFNTLLSDVIGIHRQWKGCPNRKCAHKVYPKGLPKVSAVIIFRDEYPSIVLRTVYNVLEHSNDLIEEVILVDDGSINKELKLIVNIHVANVDKLKLVTNESPLGLMMARQRGIEKVSSDYFVVMDGHMEVCDGWLKPLITRLLEEPKAVVSPCVTGISAENFEITGCEVFDGSAMYFNPLTLDQAWVPFKKEYLEKRNGSVEPLEFAVMQGMILAMRKDFFFQLGGFDPGMKVWGTEQMELSVKVWMCGGRVEMIPCSRVGHMFRVTPWGKSQNGSHHIQNNRARFAAVWLDGPHKEAVLAFQRLYDGNPGNVSDRMGIRIDNNCKPYSYFHEQVSRFIDTYSIDNIKAIGPVRNEFTNTCLDNLSANETTISDKIGSYMCMEKNGRQFFILTNDYQIRFMDKIFIVKGNRTEINVEKSTIMHHDPNTIFLYNNDNTIVHKQSGLCVTSFAGTTDVRLETCGIYQEQQVWKWRRYI